MRMPVGHRHVGLCLERRRDAQTQGGHDRVALLEARKNKETTCPELGQGNGRVQLVVIAGEVGGRWSSETKNFLWCFACEKALCPRPQCSAVLEPGTGDGSSRMCRRKGVRFVTGEQEGVTRCGQPGAIGPSSVGAGGLSAGSFV